MWLILQAYAEDPAPAPVPDSRDADIFGTPAGEPAAPFEEPEAVQSGMEERLGQLDERLTIGGRLWTQTTVRVPDGADRLSDVALDAPNLLDLYADAQANDRVRVYARGRLQHDWSVVSGATDPLTGQELAVNRVLLDQLWLKFDVGHRVFVTVGKQRIRWGTGRFWNPTDFLNGQRLDPLAVLDVRTGVDLVKLHVPFEAAGANVYALANLTDAASFDQIGGAVRAEWAFASTEITASAAARADRPLQLGADLSSGIGPLDVRAEVAVQHGARGPFYEGTFDPEALVFPSEVDRSDEWLPQVVVGAELTVKVSAEDSLSFGAEWFHNELGYDGAGLYPWLFANGGYVPLYVGRDYVAAYALALGPGNWDDQTFIVSGIANLSDRSVVARADWRGTLLTWLEPTVFVQYHFGELGELHYGVEIPANPALPDGLFVAAPAVDLGIGAIVRF